MNDLSQSGKLLVRLPNWIGDALMAYPMLLALEEFKFNVVCVGHPWAEVLFEAIGFEHIFGVGQFDLQVLGHFRCKTRQVFTPPV